MAISFVLVVVLLGVASVGMFASSEVYLDIIGNFASVWLTVFMGLVLQLTRLRHPPPYAPLTTAPLGLCVTSSFNRPGKVSFTPWWPIAIVPIAMNRGFAISGLSNIRAMQKAFTVA